MRVDDAHSSAWVIECRCLDHEWLNGKTNPQNALTHRTQFPFDENHDNRRLKNVAAMQFPVRAVHTFALLVAWRMPWHRMTEVMEKKSHRNAGALAEPQRMWPQSQASDVRADHLPMCAARVQ